MHARFKLVIVFIAVGFSVSAQAQAFFAPGVSAFTPEIGTVSTGIVHDVTATVSANRKYVTLGMRAQDAQLLAIREFTINNGPVGAGFVGGVLFDERLPASGDFGLVNMPASLGRGRGAAILLQRGMTPVREP